VNDKYPRSTAVLNHNRRFIPGRFVSVNRAAKPNIVFVKALDAYLWDAGGNRYLDYHAAFGPHFPGHNDPYVTDAVIQVLRDGASLYGSGSTVSEGLLAEFEATLQCIESALTVRGCATGTLPHRA
jgi:glutamate-1-semialdehyde 2,1-aminomutase